MKKPTALFGTSNLVLRNSFLEKKKDSSLMLFGTQQFLFATWFRISIWQSWVSICVASCWSSALIKCGSLWYEMCASVAFSTRINGHFDFSPAEPRVSLWGPPHQLWTFPSAIDSHLDQPEWTVDRVRHHVRPSLIVFSSPHNYAEK